MNHVSRLFRVSQSYRNRQEKVGCLSMLGGGFLIAAILVGVGSLLYLVHAGYFALGKMSWVFLAAAAGFITRGRKTLFDSRHLNRCVLVDELSLSLLRGPDAFNDLEESIPWCEFQAVCPEAGQLRLVRRSGPDVVIPDVYEDYPALVEFVTREVLSSGSC